MEKRDLNIKAQNYIHFIFHFLQAAFVKFQKKTLSQLENLVTQRVRTTYYTKMHKLNLDVITMAKQSFVVPYLQSFV